MKRPDGPALLPTLLVTAGLVLAACGGSDAVSDADRSTEATQGTFSSGPRPDPPGEPVRGGRLVIAADADSDGWVPAENRWLPSGLIIARAVFDPLAAFTDGGDVVPYLAETIEPNDDNTRWTIGLRDGVRFHDGSPLDAEVGAANLESVRGSALLGGNLGVVERVTVVDPLTVEVEMGERGPHSL